MVGDKRQHSVAGFVRYATGLLAFVDGTTMYGAAGLTARQICLSMTMWHVSAPGWEPADSHEGHNPPAICQMEQT